MVLGSMAAIMRDRRPAPRRRLGSRGHERSAEQALVVGERPALYRHGLRGAWRWTELDLAVPPGLLKLTVRPRLQAVARALGEIETGDLTFDALFQVQAAPADVARELLGPEVRAALVRMGGVWIVPIEGGIRVARPGGGDMGSRAELLALADALVSGIDAAYVAADRGSRARVGAPFRQALDAHELAIIEAERRGELERLCTAERRSLQMALARVVLGMCSLPALLLLL